MSGWSPERIAQAKKLYVEDGLSAEATARRLGGGVSRNAVIGIAHRQGWKRSPEVARQNISAGMPKGPRKPSAPKAKPAWKPAVVLGDGPTGQRPAVAVAPPEMATTDLTGLRTGHCKWPIGDPSQEGFGFCGRTADEGAAYCFDHRRRATQPLSRSVDTPAKLTRSLRRYL